MVRLPAAALLSLEGAKRILILSARNWTSAAKINSACGKPIGLVPADAPRFAGARVDFPHGGIYS